jgi:hypothetical protein
MTVVYIRDAYTTVPKTPRGKLEHELARTKLQLLSDASDPELRAYITELEAALRALDHDGSAA